MGEETFLAADRSNRTADVLRFLQFLIKIAERGVGDMNILDFYSQSINVGIVLLAKSEKAESHGVAPYLNRLKIIFGDGSEHVYIMAYSSARGFLKRVLGAIDNDVRYIIASHYRSEGPKGSSNSDLMIAMIRPNPLFSDADLIQKAAEFGIIEGSKVRGVVTEVSHDRALINCHGLNCYIAKSDCGWHTVLSCSNELDAGHSYEFFVKAIDKARGSIHLSRKFEDEDPWTIATVPAVNDVIRIRVHVPFDNHFICHTSDGLEVKVPMAEVVWGELLEEERISIIGQNELAEVTLVDTERRLVRASIRALTPDPWEEIKNRFPPGTQMLGSVVEIRNEFVTVEISQGIYGRIPKESLHSAGHEYRDLSNLVLGQKLQVEVKKVFVGRRKISLELSRNLDGRARPVPLAEINDKDHEIVKMKSSKPRRR